jgi:hypothetical protein
MDDRITKFRGRIKSSSCMKTPDRTPFCTQGRQLQQGGGWTPSSPLQYQFSTFRLPSIRRPDACTPRTSFCGRRRAETRRAWKSPTLQRTVLGVRHIASRPKVEKVMVMKEKFGKIIWTLIFYWLCIIMYHNNVTNLIHFHFHYHEHFIVS